MLVRPRDFQITPDEPFANDTLGRQEHVKAVCGAIAEMNGPAVVALDGGWGTDSWSPDGARNPWSAPTTELWAPTR